MILGFEQIASTGSAQKISAVSTIIPALTKACYLVRIQAEVQSIQYTIDGITAPTSSDGMVLVAGLEATEMQYADFLKFNFIQGGGGAGKLNVTYYGGPF